MSLNVFKTKPMYIPSRHKQQILANCDHDISICDSKIQVILDCDLYTPSSELLK